MADTDKTEDKESMETEKLARKTKGRSKPKAKPTSVSAGIYSGDLPPRHRLKS